MKGICLCSGGLDSTLALIKLLEEGNEVTPMFVDYNQWSLEGEEYTSSMTYHYLKGSDLGGNLETIATIKVDLNRYRLPETTAERIGSAWGRGIALVGLAAMWAYTHGDDYDFIALGNHKGDVGPDCKPGLFDKGMDAVLKVATRGKMQLLLPIAELSIEDIGVELAHYGIPWEYTYSCYWYPPCGYKSENEAYRCPGCRRKVLAMKAAGVTDGKLLNFPNGKERSYQSKLAERTVY